MQQAHDNLKNAAKAQGKEDWWEEIKKDDAKFHLVCMRYLEDCPIQLDGGRRPGFPIVQYMERTEQKKSVLLDAQYEPMDLRVYKSWMAKTKNGSVDGDKAEDMFAEICLLPGRVVDWKGLHPKRKERIAVWKKDLITYRDEESKAKILEEKNRETRKGLEKDLDAAKRQMKMATLNGDDRSNLAATFATASFTAGIGGAFSEKGDKVIHAPVFEDLERVALGDETDEDVQPMGKRRHRVGKR